ncbi:hypothetical protein LTR62_006237 [Meristemomyces frigidus]|uniref:Dynein light chain n=1 Tax=Meristemomyces frigidus TaxID=1508187 RepID=A0AAN7TBX8_9PEZI|nr:hypothetical protein LTR62_006237 [Meristemomyces frigidus]
MANSPVPASRLKQIANDACDSAISTATHYDHAQTQVWNNHIINSILKAVISESTSTADTPAQAPKYKFCVNSTIIQHLSDPQPSGGSGAVEGEQGIPTTAGNSSSAGKVGRRGMHSASGAFWNNEKDGMWSHKYDGGEARGMDIVVSLMWIAV